MVSPWLGAGLVRWSGGPRGNRFDQSARSGRNAQRDSGNLIRASLSLHDVAVGREEEYVITAAAVEMIADPSCLFLLARGRSDRSVEAATRLILDHTQRKIYCSFPMTHVMDNPPVLQEIEEFKARLHAECILYDPADVDEAELVFMAKSAQERGEREFEVAVLGESLRLSVAEILALEPNLMAQIVKRDLRLIDQADMIISLVPEIAAGDRRRPALSSGVERELDHALESGRRVYVIWKPKRQPSPFITVNATRVVSALDDLERHLANGIH